MFSPKFLMLSWQIEHPKSPHILPSRSNKFQIKFHPETSKCTSACMATLRKLAAKPDSVYKEHLCVEVGVDHGHFGSKPVLCSLTKGTMEVENLAAQCSATRESVAVTPSCSTIHFVLEVEPRHLQQLKYSL